jgi:hypothetical protein
LIADRLLFAADTGVFVSEGSMPSLLFTLPNRVVGIAVDAGNQIYTRDEQGILRLHSSDGVLLNNFLTQIPSTGFYNLLFNDGPLFSHGLYTGSESEFVKISENGQQTQSWDLLPVSGFPQWHLATTERFTPRTPWGIAYLGLRHESAVKLTMARSPSATKKTTSTT